jgi:hypothetical protein
MKRISKEKRNQLIIVFVAIAAVLGLIYFGLIRRQYGSIAKVAKDKRAADTKLLAIKTTITNTVVITKELGEFSVTLEQTESDMATGDLYSWTYDTIRHFRQSYKVEIPEVGQPATGDMNLLPNFPYKQIRFGISGTAYYHDLGKFIADFENNFPHARLVNLNIEPLPGAENSEKLTFRMEIIALVKPHLS